MSYASPGFYSQLKRVKNLIHRKIEARDFRELVYTLDSTPWYTEKETGRLALA